MAETRVLEIQRKLHRWANEDSDKCFTDLFNLICDPAFLLVAWRRVRRNKGARACRVDGQTAYSIEAERGEKEFLAELRDQLKTRSFRPLPVRERLIPKPGTTKQRRLGIPTAKDRVVQSALKLVLEPIFEADFEPCSYGFRPNRRAQDAMAAIHHFCTRSYEWVVEGDIKACFDEIDHTALMGRVRRRIGDKHVLALIKSFCKAGVLTKGGQLKDSTSGTPQGGILSPLLANIALSALDDHFARAWKEMGATSSARQAHQRKGQPTYRFVRYADDFVILVAGTEAHAAALRGTVAGILAPMGLHLSEDKTLITHIGQGFDFLGFRIHKQRKRGIENAHVYTWPGKKALANIKSKVRAITRTGRGLPLKALLHQLNPVLRGWANYFRFGVSKATFSHLRAFTWRRVVCWLRHKHPRINWKQLRRRYLPGWWPTHDGIALYNIGAVSVRRYRYRAARIPSPWSTAVV
jgi:RNA-directed DNA polymerase